ncbi:KinB-signaling pathway activation protein [Paenibacillus spongiae]|uniref:KinB-signaling pathway activation protein n=1 Tax=Paenibacillus spongiae TaxID=2909671 RepID=A0ABY5S873_9BACL|nr:KinB-signaling pathway activation protein [Paenibacillus spongiae]UVI29780.1 KinB-signaling pathway activation protein [Paenibacillus spongiae]
MNLRKWFFLFWSTAAVGAVVTIIIGTIMQWTDASFGFMGLEAAGFNALMMALVGLMFGVFSQMGFFAYLTLNYIALSVLRKKYLWNALQAYTTLFAIGGMGYILYQNREAFQNNWLFWVLPLALAAASWMVSYFKVKQTNNGAFIPTLFLLFVVTMLEAWPTLSGESNPTAIVFMMVPLFACNAYQIMWLHRLLRKDTTETTDPAANAKPAV